MLNNKVMKKKSLYVLQGIFLLVLSCTVKAASNPASMYCPAESGAEINAKDNLYEVGLLSSALAAILAGNTSAASKELGAELSQKIIALNSLAKHNPCKVSESTRAHIYPMLRVIAAVNYRHPIPGINNNEEVMNILKKAIANNPEHYKKLLTRSLHWDKGIN